MGGLRFYREFHAGSGNTSFMIQPAKKEGGNPGQSEMGFPEHTLVRRESMEMVYFHKCNVVKPIYSIQNAWRRFIHCLYTSQTTNPDGRTDFRVLTAPTTWAVANGKPVYS